MVSKRDEAIEVRYGCPTELGVELLSGKWKTILLAALKDGPKRFADLRVIACGIADKVLTERLRQLEELDFVTRNPMDGTYALSAQGNALRPMLEALYDWGRGEGLRRGVTFTALDAIGTGGAKVR